jgi:hypothetical protein
MDNNLNNNFSINQIPDIYSMIKEINNKYDILEKRQKENEKLTKNNILALNNNLKILARQYSNFKKQYEKDIDDLKNKLLNKSKENTLEKNNNLIFEEFDNFKVKYTERNNKIDKIFEEINNEIKKIKNDIVIIKNYTLNREEFNNFKVKYTEKNMGIDKTINEINNEIKKIKFDIVNDKKIELKIEENKHQTVFQQFENLLANIMSKNDIDNNNRMDLKSIIDKLLINSMKPSEMANDYLNSHYNYLIKDNKNDEENRKLLEQFCLIKEKIIRNISDIESELLMNKNKNIEKKVTVKKDKKIEKFREKHKITQGDASDEKIRNYLNMYRKEEEALKALMDSILNENKK